MPNTATLIGTAIPSNMDEHTHYGYYRDCMSGRVYAAIVVNGAIVQAVELPERIAAVIIIDDEPEHA